MNVHHTQREGVKASVSQWRIFWSCSKEWEKYAVAYCGEKSHSHHQDAEVIISMKQDDWRSSRYKGEGDEVVQCYDRRESCIISHRRAHAAGCKT